jgi:mono/diheme cytochrome c family protein
MKRLVSFLLGVAVIAGVLVLFVVFARHNGPGDSPRDDDNTKTVASATTGTTGSDTTTTSGSTTTTSTGATAGGGAAISMAVAKTTFVSTCGGCHTLADAKTGGAVGPNLDQLKPSEATVAHQIMNGGGGMPAGLLSGAKLTGVATYVSSVAGKSGSSGAATGGGTP